MSKAKALKARKAKYLVRMGYLKRLAAELKMKAVCDWVDTFLEDTDEKLVLFAIHRKVITILQERYGKKSVVIDGSTKKRMRQLMVDKFQENPRCRLFIGQLTAAGVGINLTAASTVAFVELSWVPSEHTQGEDRCHRIGTVNPVSIYYLIAKGTIEEKLCKVIQAKQRVLNRTLDGAATKVSNLDVYTQLEKELLKRT